MEKKTTTTNAYRNTSLTTLNGERWAPIPGFGDCYMVSSFGRIKSLPRYREAFIPSQQRSICYYTPERILKIKVHEKTNHITESSCYECTITLRFEGVEKTVMVSRLVYHAFIAPLDFEKDRLMIMHKDGDGLNNHFRNLKAGTRSQVTQNAYAQDRHISPFAGMSKTKFKAILKKGALSRQKPVLQFNAAGKKIRQFSSIKLAARKTGVADSNIIEVLKRRRKFAGGYSWKYAAKKSAT